MHILLACVHQMRVTNDLIIIFIINFLFGVSIFSFYRCSREWVRVVGVSAMKNESEHRFIWFYYLALKRVRFSSSQKSDLTTITSMHTLNNNLFLFPARFRLFFRFARETNHKYINRIFKKKIAYIIANRERRTKSTRKRER